MWRSRIGWKALIGCALIVCGGVVQALDVAGSSTIQPVVAAVIPLYTAAGGEPVKVSGGGSGAGVKKAAAGEVHIGMASRSISAQEQTQVKHLTIGIDAVVMIVHRDNPVSGLTRQQVVDLYAGKVANWREIGGADRTVQRISKEVGRSTLELFEAYSGLLSPDRPKTEGKPLIAADAFIIGSNLESLTLVGGMPGAIGYVSYGTAEEMIKAGMPVKILTLDQVRPGKDSIMNRSWPLVRELNLVWRDETPAVRAFLDLTMSAAGQRVVQAQGFMPMRAP